MLCPLCVQPILDGFERSLSLNNPCAPGQAIGYFSESKCSFLNNFVALIVGADWFALVFSRQCFPRSCPVCLLRCWLGILCWVFPYGARYKQAGPPARGYLLTDCQIWTGYHPWAACCKRSCNRHLICIMYVYVYSAEWNSYLAHVDWLVCMVILCKKQRWTANWELLKCRPSYSTL